MVRRYADRPVDPAVVERALEHAPGRQRRVHPGRGVPACSTSRAVIERSGTRPPSRAPTDRWLTGMRRAPVVVVPLTSREAYLDRYAEPDKGWTDRDPGRWPVPYWYVDSGMAALLLLQTAVDEGLGACFFGIPPERVDAFRAAFGVPADRLPVGAVTLGHRVDDSGTAGSPSRRRRRPAAELVHRGRWGDTGLGSEIGDGAPRLAAGAPGAVD